MVLCWECSPWTHDVWVCRERTSQDNWQWTQHVCLCLSVCLTVSVCLCLSVTCEAVCSQLPAHCLSVNGPSRAAQHKWHSPCCHSSHHVDHWSCQCWCPQGMSPRHCSLTCDTHVATQQVTNVKTLTSLAARAIADWAVCVVLLLCNCYYRLMRQLRGSY